MQHPNKNLFIITETVTISQKLDLFSEVAQKRLIFYIELNLCILLILNLHIPVLVKK